MRYLLFLIVCVPSLLSAQNRDTYEIYSQIIMNDFKNDSLITIENVTTFGLGDTFEQDYKYLKNFLKKLKLETYNDFKFKNVKSDTIKDNFSNKSFKVIILSRAIQK